MAERTEGSTTIKASASEVMEVLTDFDGYPAWAGMKSAKVLDTDGDGRGL